MRKFMLIILCLIMNVSQIIIYFMKEKRKKNYNMIEQWPKPTRDKDRKHGNETTRTTSVTNNNIIMHWPCEIASMRNATYGLSVTRYEHHNRFTHSLTHKNIQIDQNANRIHTHRDPLIHKPESTK